MHSKELNMETLAFWAAIFANTACAALLMLYFRQKVRTGLVGARRAKRRYSWWYLPLGILVAVTLFYALAALLDVPTGHGEILVTVSIFNVGLSLILLLEGRVVISWKPLQWW